MGAVESRTAVLVFIVVTCIGHTKELTLIMTLIGRVQRLEIGSIVVAVGHCRARLFRGGHSLVRGGRGAVGRRLLRWRKHRSWRWIKQCIHFDILFCKETCFFFFFLLVMLGIWRYQGGMMSQAAILPRHVCDRRSRLPERKTKHIALNINVDKKSKTWWEKKKKKPETMVSRFICLYASYLDETLK